MAGIELEVENLEKVQKAMEDVAKEISRSGNLVSRAAMIIERQAKINATGRPGPHVQTGRLRASIVPEIIDSQTARVGTNVFYASYVELGHRQKAGRFVPAIGKRLVADFAPAYPFISPTVDQCKDDLGNMMVTYGNELGVIWQK